MRCKRCGFQRARDNGLCLVCVAEEWQKARLEKSRVTVAPMSRAE